MLAVNFQLIFGLCPANRNGKSLSIVFNAGLPVLFSQTEKSLMLLGKTYFLFAESLHPDTQHLFETIWK